MKKPPSKNAHNLPKIVFKYWPCCPNEPKTEILYHQRALNAGLGIYTGDCNSFSKWDLERWLKPFTDPQFMCQEYVYHPMWLFH